MDRFWAKWRARQDGPTGFLRRLARDRRGNVLFMVAACSLPIAGFIGSGLDLSRAYLVRTRLQQACDAGVLAGRKVMGAGGSLNSKVQAEVTKFVNFNFPPGTINTTPLTIAPTMDAATDTINLGLSTQMDTAMMNLFGIRTVPIAVTCSARDDYANIDIVLVLDTTGSMACAPSRSEQSCSNYINGTGGYRTTTINGRAVEYAVEENNGTNISRIQALRDALTSLRAQMQSIEDQFNSASAGTRRRVRFAIIPFSQMVNAGRGVDAAGTELAARNPGWFNSEGIYAKNCGGSGCGGAVRVAHNPLWMSNVWDGCVEERQTSNTVTPSSTWRIPDNLPPNAYDLKFDVAPTDTATRWTVADPSIEPDSQYACPKAARELGSMASNDFNAYFRANTGFLANGGTFLDVGMLWAARYLSRSGLWSADNPVTYNGFPVRRYVIFMTDGEMQTGSGTWSTSYAAYAQEYYFRRVTSSGTTTSNDANHLQRLQMTCTAIKNMDVDIYAISFGGGSTLSAPLTGCSSGSGYGFKADNAAQLNQVFRSIGDDIGSLRLSQ